MIDNRFWNIKRNHIRFKEIVKYHDKTYCFDCQKPMRRHFSIRCNKCTYILINEGVPFGTVGLSVVNYQQYLHRSFFTSVNPPVKYRGVKEDRINIKIDQTILDKSVKKLSKILLRRRNEHIDMYKATRHLKPNITKRLLYNITLHFISYHIENSKIWESEAMFMASVMNHIHSQIHSTWIKLTNQSGIKLPYKLSYKRKQYGIKYKYRMYEELEELMCIIMGGLKLKII